MPPVAIAYDAAGGRRTKHFADPYVARRFYVQLFKAGRRPAVINPNPKEIVMATKQKSKKQPAKRQTKPAAAGPATPGVRASTKTRPYLAGMVIKRHGLAAGVTPAMVAELDKLMGVANPVESTGRLKTAWHAIRGYLGKE